MFENLIDEKLVDEIVIYIKKGISYGGFSTTIYLQEIKEKFDLCDEELEELEITLHKRDDVAEVEDLGWEIDEGKSWYIVFFTDYVPQYDENYYIN